MPSASRYQNVVNVTVSATVASSILLALFYSYHWRQGQVRPSGGGTPRPQDRNVISEGTNRAIWTVFQARSENQPGRASSTQSTPDRFRLAGTFFIEGAGESRRKAILDDTVRRDQFILGEGESLAEVTVEKIFFDHVIIRTPTGVRELWVEFASRTSSPATSLTNAAPASIGSTNKFGCVLVQENRWKFSRKPILDYYQELLDDPDRMVTVFDTMKPVRDEKNKISGYVVGLEGEKDFFDAVGLQQGDIVRSVNSLPMTNRRRAEALIDQFLKDQMNAVVLEVERAGKTVKQVYQLQP